MSQGCGAESITVKVEATTGAEEDYDNLYVKALDAASKFLPGRALHRNRGDCGGTGGFGSGVEEWYIGCAHSEITPIGTKIVGVFTFVRHGTEQESF